MGVIGALEYADSTGTWHEIDVYDVGTFPEGVVEIQLSDGRWGEVYATDPTQADTPFEVAKSDGTWLGINSVGGIIEDWERGNFDPWTQTTSGSFDDMDINSSAAYEGDLGMDSTGDYQGHIASFPGDGLITYPQRGDEFDMWIQMAQDLGTSFTPLARYQWELDPADGYTTDNLYRFDINPTELNLQKRVDGDTLGMLTFSSWDITDNAWYRINVNYTDPTITVTPYDSSGTQVESSQSIDDTTHDYNGDGGVAIFASDDAQWYYDAWTLVLA